MKKWGNDNELFRLCRTELYTAVVGDIMDMLGIYHQFLPPQIRPLRNDMVAVGRAMTVLIADDVGSEGPSRSNELLNQPFGLMLKALDDLKENEIYICTGASPNYALWGELMSTAAINQGAVGVVVNGYSRDTKNILKLGFPTFSYGPYAQDQRPRGKVIDFRCNISIYSVIIQPGDIIFADIDGVCIIPWRIEEEVITKALEKARGEKLVFQAIKGGMSSQDAWHQFGIM